MRIETLLFFICPFSFNVYGWDIPVMAANEIFGVSSSSFEWQSCWVLVSSSLDSSHSEIFSSSSASHAYKFWGLLLCRHLCLGSHFSPQYLLFPSLILWASKLGFAPSFGCGSVYLEIHVFADWRRFLLK